MRTEKENMKLVGIVVLGGLIGGCISLMGSLLIEMEIITLQYDGLGLDMGNVTKGMSVFWFVIMGIGVMFFLGLIWTRRHNSPIKSLVRHFQRDSVVDLMLEKDIRWMERTKQGRSYFVYFNQAIHPRKGLMVFNIVDGELHIKLVRSHPVPYTKGGRLISIWGKQENRYGYVIHYTNPTNNV